MKDAGDAFQVYSALLHIFCRLLAAAGLGTELANANRQQSRFPLFLPQHAKTARTAIPACQNRTKRGALVPGPNFAPIIRLIDIRPRYSGSGWHVAGGMPFKAWCVTRGLPIPSRVL